MGKNDRFDASKSFKRYCFEIIFIILILISLFIVCHHLELSSD